MSNILIVGNVLKDVYLNLDARTENFETDRREIDWLDLEFNGSTHQFFSRTSTFGGAAVSLDVLTSMGVSATISGSSLSFEDDLSVEKIIPDGYRYILVANEKVSYFVPSIRKVTNFVEPKEPVQYIFIDRSAKVQDIKKILEYLGTHSETKLVLYVDKNPRRTEFNRLIERADLVFSERELPDIDREKVIFINSKSISYLDTVERFRDSRIDLSTHLSTYSLIAATVLGGIALGKSIPEALRLAKINVENASIDASLSLAEMEEKISEDNEDGDDDLRLLARSLMMPGKGILAADESGKTMAKKFASFGVEDSYENRRNFRNLLFTTPELNKHVNGVILYDETARQLADNGLNFVEFLTSRGIIPGIKVDKGLEKTYDSDETVTRGIKGLAERLAEYYAMGFRFAKWRAEFRVRPGTPSEQAIAENCRLMAEYAKLCQEAGLVPIVEPELSYDGDYSIEESGRISGLILNELFNQLRSHQVELESCVLKTNMILAGKEFEKQSTPSEVALATAKLLESVVPKELAGVVFLSGGQTPEQATENLKAIAEKIKILVSFSFGRALEDPAFIAWDGKDENIKIAQEKFTERLRANTTILKKM